MSEAINKLDQVEDSLPNDDPLYTHEAIPQELIDRAWRTLETLIEPGLQTKVKSFSEIIRFYILFVQSQDEVLNDVGTLYPEGGLETGNLALGLLRQTTVLELSRNVVAATEATSVLTYSRYIEEQSKN